MRNERSPTHPNKPRATEAQDCLAGWRNEDRDPSIGRNSAVEQQPSHLSGITKRPLI